MKNGDDWELFDLSMDRLPELWLEQARLYHKHAVKLAEAKHKLNRAKAEKALREAELEEVVAKIDQEVRRNPELFGFEDGKKPTEKALENTVLLDARYADASRAVLKGATDDVIEAQHLVDVLYAVVNSLDQRKEALQDLVKLEGRDQFAQPRADKPNKERMDEAERDRAFGARRKAKR